MTDYPAILRELVIAGYEGAHLLAAFERMCVAIGGGVSLAPSVADPAVGAVPVMSPVARKARRRVAEPDRRQGEFKYPIAGGQAKTPPLSPAERQAKRRARLKSVTLRDSNSAQVIEIIEESRNVTPVRDSLVQAIDLAEDFGTGGRRRVTGRGKKEIPPHPPKKKQHPQIPPRDEFVVVHWDDPLLAAIEQHLGKRFGRFGAGRTFRRVDLDKLRAAMADPPPLQATGCGA